LVLDQFEKKNTDNDNTDINIDNNNDIKVKEIMSLTLKNRILNDKNSNNKILTEMYLEWGLCCHHFDFGDKGKASFTKAKVRIYSYSYLR
jgi:hypothetical protein